MSPSRFIHEPLDWLVELSRRRATITAAPQFAYDLCLSKAEKRLDQLDHLDLSSVRCMINGAEMISPASCREFERVFGRFGLRRHAIFPAYGMAENCVMVAMRCPGRTPALCHFDRRALAAGEARPVRKSHDTIELIGHGPPAQGVEVLVRGPDGRYAEGRVGEIYVGGTSAAPYFVDAQGSLSAASDDGFVPSGDLGFVLAGELYCIGRSKEVFNRGGRTYSPIDIERELLECEGVSPGSIAVFSVAAPAARDELVIAVVAHGLANGDFDALAARIRRCVLREFRFTPSEIVPVDFVPRTSSGKVRRGLLRDLYARGELGVDRASR
jgi:acyl-CoA synthetase (AMP-forming)/AMP-acid ligase II